MCLGDSIIAAIVLKDPVRTAQCTHSVSGTKTSQLMLYREIIAVCSEIHTKHINTLCGQNVELMNVKLAVHIVTTVRLTAYRAMVQRYDVIAVLVATVSISLSNTTVSISLSNTTVNISLLLLLLSVGLPVANAPDVLQPCGLLYYP